MTIENEFCHREDYFQLCGLPFTNSQRAQRVIDHICQADFLGVCIGAKIQSDIHSRR